MKAGFIAGLFYCTACIRFSSAYLINWGYCTVYYHFHTSKVLKPFFLQSRKLQTSKVSHTLCCVCGTNLPQIHPNLQKKHTFSHLPVSVIQPCFGFEISISEISGTTPIQRRGMKFCLRCSPHLKSITHISHSQSLVILNNHPQNAFFIETISSVESSFKETCSQQRLTILQSN